MKTNLSFAKRKQYCADIFRQTLIFPFTILHPITLYHTLKSDEDLLEAILIHSSVKVLNSDDTLVHSTDKT